MRRWPAPVIGGVSFATFATLLFVPAMYRLLRRNRHAINLWLLRTCRPHRNNTKGASAMGLIKFVLRRAYTVAAMMILICVLGIGAALPCLPTSFPKSTFRSSALYGPTTG